MVRKKLDGLEKKDAMHECLGTREGIELLPFGVVSASDVEFMAAHDGIQGSKCLHPQKVNKCFVWGTTMKTQLKTCMNTIEECWCG
jgi:hypothetical protein